jgi:hypothetical protein
MREPYGARTDPRGGALGNWRPYRNIMPPLASQTNHENSRNAPFENKGVMTIF